MQKHFMNKQHGAHMQGKPAQDVDQESGQHKPSIHIHSHGNGHTVHVMHHDGRHETHEHEHGDAEGITQHIHEHIGGEQGAEPAAEGMGEEQESYGGY